MLSSDRRREDIHGDEAAASSTASPSAVQEEPKRFIYSDDDLQRFLASPAKRELLQVTAAMGRACASVDDDDDSNNNDQDPYEYDPSEPLVDLSPALAALVGSLQEMQQWIADLPPEDPSRARFGNPAFRQWHRRLVQQGPFIVRCVVRHHSEQMKKNNDPLASYEMAELRSAAEDGRRAARVDASDAGASADHNNENDDDDDATDPEVVTELSAYLCAAFGHPIRLDFGTGHECSFQVFLYCLLKLGCFGSTADRPPTIRRLRAASVALYSSYVAVARQLQTGYMLEPAGSHGVWGLDDYHCLPFYLGACQLQTQDEYNPKSIHDDSILRREGDKYLYFGCIRYIKSIKRGVPFFESSPMLNDISQLSSWQKVSAGLLRLFEGEVLSKRQVVQHLVFGKIFAANWTTNEDPSPSVPHLPPDSLFVGGAGSGGGGGSIAFGRRP
jgi:serine/threonine-protein phosphatase 2A activator